MEELSYRCSFYQFSKKKKPFILIEIAGSNCDSKYLIDRTPDFYSIEYIISGQQCVEIDGQKFILGENDVCILPNGVHHKYYPQKESITKIWIALLILSQPSWNLG